mmetsp:Transcript_25083/g.60343  ORF Transcript_25083/g.60343 Transcript_25083/m.60343 type:complete len:106 (-) Transcript_25083:758-1075(-)
MWLKWLIRLTRTQSALAEVLVFLGLACAMMASLASLVNEQNARIIAATVGNACRCNISQEIHAATNRSNIHTYNGMLKNFMAVFVISVILATTVLFESAPVGMIR